jgi:hypothetical protein
MSIFNKSSMYLMTVNKMNIIYNVGIDSKINRKKEAFIHKLSLGLFDNIVYFYKEILV